MARRPRLHVPGGFYHVTLRGNHRNDIFFTEADRRRLDETVASALEKTQCRLHAYCWMTNHLHMLVQVSDRPLGALMQRIGTRYARRVQQQLETTGHLFERRYYALLVDVDAYFLELLRYIHLNPVRAGIVDSADRYRWSSHRAYLGQVSPSWVHCEFGLSLLHADPNRARQSYSSFIAERTGARQEWTDFETHPEEPRVMGGDLFLSKITAELVRQRGAGSLTELAGAIFAETGVTLELLRSSSRNAPVIKARIQLTHSALDARIATISEIARFLGRSVAAISRAAQTQRQA